MVGENLKDDVQLLLKRIKVLEEDALRTKTLLAKVKGDLIIQGYAGKKFDLNENLNVVDLMRKLNGKQDVQSSSVKVVKTDYSMATTDALLVTTCDSLVDFNLRLPPATKTGNYYAIANVNVGIVTVSSLGGLINGDSSQYLNQWDIVTFYDYDVGKWFGGL